MSEWPVVNLGEVVELITGFPFKSKEYSGNGSDPKLLRGDNIVQGHFRWEDVKRWPESKIIDKHQNYWLKEGDVILAMDRPWIEAGLKYAQITEPDLPCLLVQRTSCLRTKSGFDQDFLRYLISSYHFVEYVKLVQTGTAVPHISGKQILDFEFRLPPQNVQFEIGRILRSLDNKIELNRQTNQTLEQIAQALFKSWFVNFDPVKAKIAAKQTGGNVEQIERAAMAAISGKTETEVDQLNPDQFQQLKTTAALFPDALVDSELGEIPEGWIVFRIKDFGNIVCGKTPSKARSENYGNFMPFIKIPDMHGTMFVVQPIECLSEAGVKSQPKKIIPAGSICVSCIATVGKVVITHQNSQTNQQINCIIPFEESSSYYLYFYMTSLNNLFHDLASGGSATLNMNTSTFSNIELLKPNTEALKMFYKSISPVLKQVLSNLEENRNLEGLRNTLLPKLLAGEVEVA